MCEVPIEMVVKRDAYEACIQTDENQDMHWEESAVEGRNRLFASNQGIESRLIEVPIELNILLEKDTANVEVQTGLSKEWERVDFPHK